MRLDNYNLSDVDDEVYEGMDLGTRALVEAKLKKRDKKLARQKGLPLAFMDEQEPLVFKTRRRRRHDEFEEEFFNEDQVKQN